MRLSIKNVLPNNVWKDVFVTESIASVMNSSLARSFNAFTRYDCGPYTIGFYPVGSYRATMPTASPLATKAVPAKYDN